MNEFVRDVWFKLILCGPSYEAALSAASVRLSVRSVHPLFSK